MGQKVQRRSVSDRSEHILAIAPDFVWGLFHPQCAARRKTLDRAVSGTLSGLHEADKDAAALRALKSSRGPSSPPPFAFHHEIKLMQSGENFDYKSGESRKEH
jgi:hypothetical protein